MQTDNRIYWIDNLRAIACFSVILLHVSGPWLLNILDFRSTDWISVNVIHSATRFCVPVFLMISGSLLLNRKYATAYEFYSHHLLKIIKPFIFWSFLYILLFLVVNIYQGQNYNLSEILNFVKGSIIYGAAYHLWYIYLIIALFLIMPFASKLKSVVTLNHTAVFLTAWIIMLMLAEQFSEFVIFQYMRLTFGYFGYVVLGAFINDIKLKTITSKILSITLISFGLVGTFYPVLYTALNFNYVNINKYYFLSLNVMLLSTGVFLLVKSFNVYSSVLSFISKHSFGIYFIHLFYIMMLNKIWVNNEIIPLPLDIILFALVCLGLSYFSISLLKRIPLLSKVIE